uniref:5'-nucleotidase domain-containing protein 1 n=1 Tax=Monodelphis domestica TaxID=13616 RepID=F6Z7W4_MONDO
MTEPFSLADCDVVGFDLDHTLCCYNLPESAQLIYDSCAQYLVNEKGYAKELLSVPPASWDFCCKGLALDLEDGNFIKLAHDGTVLRASHGTKMMTSEELLGIYGKKKWQHFTEDPSMVSRSAKYYFYDNYFDLPGALLCARIVDGLTEKSNLETFDFWKDILASVHHNYKTTAFKENSGMYYPAIKSHPGKYLKICPESVKKWFQQLKSAGKILLIITNSYSNYCRLLCDYAIGNDFTDIFDIVISNALKPGFFSQQPNKRLFLTIEDDEEQDALPSLDKPGWYSQGNSDQLYELLKKMTGKAQPKVVYFGDSMHSDIFPAHYYSNWETVLILEELRENEDIVPKRNESEPLEKKGKYEGQHIKPLYSFSKQWGSFFVDGILGKENMENLLTFTWSCKRIHDYSTITVPSLEAIADLPLDYKFTRFSSDDPKMTGYYPKPPMDILSSGKSLTTK